MLGREECFGEVYNVVNEKPYSWKEYHIEAMNVIGKKVELIEVSFKDLSKFKIPRFGLCQDYTSHDAYYSSEKLLKILPKFKSKISLNEGMHKVFKSMDEDGRIKNSFRQNWEDRIIRKKNKGTFKNGLLINAFLFNFDRIIVFIKRRLLRL